MNDVLAKIGIPTAIGIAISLVVVVTPMLFKIDERYAKQEALEAEVQKLEKQNAELRAELAQATGFQQAMVAFIQQGRLPVPAVAALHRALKYRLNRREIGRSLMKGLFVSSVG